MINMYDDDSTIDKDSRIKTEFGIAFLNKSGRYVVRFNKYTYVSLHRLVYKKYVGEIPRNFEIHHKDFNKLNNAPENLVALSKDEHKILHEEERRRKRAHKRAQRKGVI